MTQEINIFVVLAILFIHWFADFYLQNDQQAVNKSSSNRWLLSHTYDYSIFWLFMGLSFLIVTGNTHDFKIFHKVLAFGGITFVCHTIQDYITSRINSKLWKAEKRHWFFVSVGFDQFLHYVQLFLTFQYLFGTVDC